MNWEGGNWLSEFIKYGNRKEESYKMRGGGGEGSSRGKGGMSRLKKGPWTKAEDAILVEYVRKHGEGNWNAVQKNSGLLRCGKSCRLRWTNHLRPNLKKGSFSRDEVLLILRLHAQLGNKWARMAAQLPGRTDNEIKNYWNTRIKKRIKAGLPLCPPEIQPPEERSSSATTPPSTPSGSLAEATSSSSQFPMPPNPIDFTATPPPPPPFLTHHYFSPASLSFSSSSTVSSPSAAGLFQHSLRNYELSAMVAHHPVPELSPFSVNSELPSTQLFPEPLGLGMDGSSDQSRNSGLLDTLLQEPKGLSTLLGEKPQKLPLDDQELKIALLGSLGHRDEQLEPLEGRGKGGGAHPWEPGRDSGHVSKGEEFGMKPKKQPTDEINAVHGDLSMLLDMIPTVSMPRTTMFPDWYNGDSREMSYGKSSGLNDDGLELELQQLASSLSVKPEDNEWTIGSCLWNNMPNIC